MVVSCINTVAILELADPERGRPYRKDEVHRQSILPLVSRDLRRRGERVRCPHRQHELLLAHPRRPRRRIPAEAEPRIPLWRRRSHDRDLLPAPHLVATIVPRRQQNGGRSVRDLRVVAGRAAPWASLPLAIRHALVALNGGDSPTWRL